MVWRPARSPIKLRLFAGTVFGFRINAHLYASHSLTRVLIGVFQCVIGCTGAIGAGVTFVYVRINSITLHIFTFNINIMIKSEKYQFPCINEPMR